MTRGCAICEWFDGGLCRRLPPSMPPWPQDNQHPIAYVPTATWPDVKADDWCGEFRRAGTGSPREG